MNKNAVFSVILFCISTLLALGAAEAVLRIKNSAMNNYDIEMWRYARLLKRRSWLIFVNRRRVLRAC